MNHNPTPEQIAAVEKYEDDLKKMCRQVEERIKQREENKRIEKLNKSKKGRKK